MNQPPSNNITRLRNTPSVPIAGHGQSHKEEAGRHVKIATEPMVRNLAPLTRYNADSGMAEPIDDMGSLSEEGSEEVKAQPAAESDRHSKWKEEQAAKKEAREAAKAERASKQQASAKDLLRKGDLIGAAQALGLSPSDLAMYVDNARLQIANPSDEPKELSPEEQRAADEAKYKQDRLDFEKEQRDWKYRTVADTFIKDKIAPVLADQEKFEYIHNPAFGGANEWQEYAYDYMNKHYQATCTFNEEQKRWNTDGETLSPKDVLESIEEQLFTAHVASLEKAKGIKKVAKYFQSERSEAPEDRMQLTGDEPEVNANDFAKIKTPGKVNRMNIQKTDRPFVREEEVETPDLNISQAVATNFSEVRRQNRASAGQTGAWHSLTRAEKLAIVRKEEEQERQRARR